MVANAPIPHDSLSAVVARLNDLEKKVDNGSRRVPNNLLVEAGGGQVLISIGPSGFVDADGNILNSVTINDPISGTPIISQTPASTTVNPDGTVEGDDWFWRMDDEQGNRLIATDGKSGVGLALPYISVPMYPQWNGLTTTPANGTGYASTAASNLTAQKLMWEGRIGYVSHPQISFDGIWGRSTGSGAEVITYTAMVAGNAIGTWQATGIITGPHQFDISGLVTETDLQVQILAQSSISNTDLIACQLMGAWLRQSP